MSHPLEGVTRFIQATAASTGAGPTNVNLRPAAGMVWEVLWAVGYQDDGAVACNWNGVDPDTTVYINGFTGQANVYVHLGTQDDLQDSADRWHAPIVITYDRYLQFQFTASAGGKNGYVRAIVKEFRGVAMEA